MFVVLGKDLVFDWFLRPVGLEYAVTTVESGTRALQYLGLDGEKGPVGFDVRNELGLGCIHFVSLLRKCVKSLKKKGRKFFYLFFSRVSSEPDQIFKDFFFWWSDSDSYDYRA